MKKNYLKDIHWWYNEYYRYMLRVLAPSTTARRMYALETFFERHLDKSMPEEFHRWHFDEYIEQRKRENIQMSTIALELRTLAGFWSWLRARELAVVNPVKHVPLRETVKPILTYEEVCRLLAQCHTIREKLICLIPLTTGLNQRQLAQLRWTDVDLDTAVLRFNDLVLPLREDVVKLLREYQQPEREYVFPSRLGNPVGVHNGWSAIISRVVMHPKPRITQLRLFYIYNFVRHGIYITRLTRIGCKEKLDVDFLRTKLSTLPYCP